MMKLGWSFGIAPRLGKKTGLFYLKLTSSLIQIPLEKDMTLDQVLGNFFSVKKIIKKCCLESVFNPFKSWGIKSLSLVVGSKRSIIVTTTNCHLGKGETQLSLANNSIGNHGHFFSLQKLFDEISGRDFFPFLSMVLPSREVLPCLLSSVCMF